jgi:hypothetical protein
MSIAIPFSKGILPVTISTSPLGQHTCAITNNPTTNVKGLYYWGNPYAIGYGGRTVGDDEVSSCMM